MKNCELNKNFETVFESVTMVKSNNIDAEFLQNVGIEKIKWISGEILLLEVEV